MHHFVRGFAVCSVVALSVGCGNASESESGDQSATGGSSDADGGSATGGNGGSGTTTGGSSGASSSGGSSPSGGSSGLGGSGGGSTTGGADGSGGFTTTAGNGGAPNSGGYGAFGGSDGLGGSGGISTTGGNGGSGGFGTTGGSSGATSAGGSGASGGSGGDAGAGGTTGGSAGASGSSGGSAGGPSVECEVYDEHHGFVWCDELRWVHRESVQTCDSSLPRADTSCGQPSAECSTDAECAAEPYGFCTTTAENQACHCEYGCTQDSDCGLGELCYCRNFLIGVCLPATCVSDADCESGYHCAGYEGFLCGALEGFACQSPADECTDGNDCESFAACQMGESNARVCGPCGIP